MRSPARRPILAGLIAALAIGLLPVATAAASGIPESTIAAAERSMLDLTNSRRSQAGLVALRADTRLYELARERAAYMAETERFSHTQSDGTDVFDLITDRGITWYGAGEIIAWNTAADLDYSASFAVSGWMGSPPHKSILLSSGYNYVGFGLAISPSTGKRYWAGVYMKGPDRTGAYAKLGTVSSTVVDARSAKVKATWSGKDVRLQVLTSGFRYYQVQMRLAGGNWNNYGTTTATSFTRTWTRGRTYDIRVRSRDKAGNWGGWSYKSITP
jgi:uncharacterized protein YkwD